MTRSHGSSKPSAFFITDSPQGDDLKTEYALTGYAGNTLREFCKEQGLSIDTMWRACLIREPLDKSTAYKPEQLKILVDKYAPYLINEINELQPYLLIPLGELSFNFLTGLNGIRKFRGSILSPVGDILTKRENLKVLPILGTYPYLNQENKLRVISRLDFTKVSKYLNDSPIPDKVNNLWVARSASALRSFLDRAYPICFKKSIAEGGYLVFDIETFMQIPICISFCFDGSESVCTPLLDASIDRDNRALMMQLVARILNSPLPKVNQNIKYDWKILERWMFFVNNVVGDTMLTASCLYPEFPKNLGFLTSIYTDIPYFKDEGKEFDPDKGKRDRYYLYNAKDSLATYQIYRQQIAEVEEMGVSYVHTKLESLKPVYKRMENRGIRIDRLKQDSLLAKYESLYHIQELKLRSLTGKILNPLSPKQVKALIFDELGYSKVRGMKTTASGDPSTDEESLDLLLVYGDPKRAPGTGPPVLRAIIAARKIHKVIEILELHLHPDDRFRCEFNLAGTENGRTSAGVTTDQLITIESDKKVKIINIGHSLQTIGKHGFMVDGSTYGRDVRSIFVPSPGFKFVECDLSGAEARVDRVLSGNFDMKVFEGAGIHRLTGSWIFGCEPHEIKKDILVDGIERYLMSKVTRHAGERNMGPERLVMMTQRPLRECREILTKFHEADPAIRKVFHKGVEEALAKRILRAPNGRFRQFFDIRGQVDKHNLNEGISYLPQAIVSDQTKFSGIAKTFSDASVYGYAHLLTEQHDGVLMEVIADRALEVGETYKKNIEEDLIDFRSCTLQRDYQLMIPCEVSVGEDWDSMEEVK